MRHINGGQFDLQSHGRGGQKAVCMACGSPRRKKESGIIRLGEDDWGTYDICESCAIELGTMMGMVTKEKADELRKKNRKLGSDLKAEKKRADDMTDAVARYFSPEEVA